MAQRLSRKLFVSVQVALILLLAQRGDAQSPTPPPLPPSSGTSPKTSEPPAAAKELSKQEVDGLIEKAFGRDCAELRRPIRVWIADISMVVVAEKASVARDGRSVRFASASIGLVNLPEIKAEVQILRGDETFIAVDRPITQWRELLSCRVRTVEIHDKSSVVTLTPDANRLFRGVTETVEREAAPTFPRPASEKIETPPQKIKVGQPKPPETVDVPAPPPESSIRLPQPDEKVPEAGRPLEIRFKFKIDPKAPFADLLPMPPKATAKLPRWTNEDLAKVPELTFGEPISKKLPKQKAMETTAHVMAKINHLNLKKTDGFMLAMIEQRSDLRGLQFLMGDACRMREEQAKVFAMIAAAIRMQLNGAKVTGDIGEAADGFWSTRRESAAILQQGAFKAENNEQTRFPRATQDSFNRSEVAALMQILMPESEHFRLGLARHLAMIPHIDATKALAKLAIFSPEDEVRAAAIEGLKVRRERDYTDILMQGFRYPLPAVSKRAAEALVKLERKDLLANLVEVLEQPDPRLPVTRKQDGKEVSFVRELVRVNHHRNCLLCHAPGNTDNTPEGVLKVAVPLPGEPLPKPSEGGGYESTPPPSPDIVVRLDMTYLRQDFSLMMPVSDPHPWPELQRFDFLVRTRTLTAAEAQAYEPCCEAEEPGRLSPYHRSALYALRELTGRDTEPTPAAWRKLLKLPARNNKRSRQATD